MRTLISYLLGDLRPSMNDTVIAVKHTVYVIAWMAINQSVWFAPPLHPEGR